MSNQQLTELAIAAGGCGKLPNFDLMRNTTYSSAYYKARRWWQRQPGSQAVINTWTNKVNH